MKITYALFLITSLFSTIQSAQAQPGYLARYKYQVSDISKMGLDGQKLFDDMARSRNWMDLKHSVCSNRAAVWSYDLHRRYKLNTGTIFIFFGANVWAGDKKSWMYHAGTYIMDKGEERVIEGTYPDETNKPQTIVEWMDTEMEGRADATKCLEITEADTDLTAYFYNQTCLPEVRENGKKGAPCYYRKVPGHIHYPVTVAELEFGVDVKGKPIDYKAEGFDMDELFAACTDAYAGKNGFRKGSARSFCASYL